MRAQHYAHHKSSQLTVRRVLWWRLFLFLIMKILFLDIDGVLNSTDNMAAMSELWRINKDDKSEDNYGRLGGERCVRWLKFIIAKTDCKIVLSSTWRRSGFSVIQTMWQMRELPGEVIDITPTSVSQETINLYATNSNEADRGYEIQEWIDIHKPDKYCIVDDDSDMLPHQNFVQTNSKIGLDYSSALVVCRFLNAP